MNEGSQKSDPLKTKKAKTDPLKSGTEKPDPLKTYREKRDFSLTSEPSGEGISTSDRIFVVQEHSSRQPALRSAPGGRRRPQVLGRSQRSLPRSQGQASGHTDRRPSSGICPFPGHDPGRPVRCRNCGRVGYGSLSKYDPKRWAGDLHGGGPA